MTIKIETLEEAKSITRQAKNTLPYYGGHRDTATTGAQRTIHHWTIIRRFLLIMSAIGAVVGFTISPYNTNSSDIQLAVVAICVSYFICMSVFEFLVSATGGEL